MSLDGATELLMSLKGARQSQMLVQEKLAQWDWFQRFLGLNPDVAARWEQHKTYEILKDEYRER